MLTISQAQMSKMAVLRNRQFVESMRARFATSLTASGVEAYLERARRAFGIQSERDLVAFLEFCEELGADFESRPETAWIARDLADRSIGPASVRLKWVRERKARLAIIKQHNRAQREDFLK